MPAATHIAKIEADRLVDEVTRSLRDASTFAAAGHVPATTHPGNVAAPVDEVYWWGSSAAQLDLTPIWDARRTRGLVGSGCPTVVYGRPPGQRTAGVAADRR